jgi:beta-phosphoglucomutase
LADFSKIKGFIFDLDGVIADTSKYHSKAWHELADELGVTWTKSLENGLKGIGRMDSLMMILKAGNKEHAFNESEKNQLTTKKNDYYLTLIKGMTEEDVLPEITPFLEDLDAHHYKICLASASKNAPIILKKLNLVRFFAEVVDPTTLKKGKPNPEIFIRGAEQLNLRPEECIGIEDAAAGIQAINDAGETSIGIGDADELHAADINLASTKELTLKRIESELNVKVK